jgi:hypothetical protein
MALAFELGRGDVAGGLLVRPWSFENEHDCESSQAVPSLCRKGFFGGPSLFGDDLDCWRRFVCSI